MKYFLLFLLLTAEVVAATWVSNKDHSELLFQVPYMSVSELTGRFDEFEAQANFQDKGEAIEDIQIKIDASSINTSNKMRDGHLKDRDFLFSTQYPHILFNSQSVKKIKDNSYKAQGLLTIKGVTKPVEVSFTTTESMKDTWGYENKFVKFKSKISRKDFNIKWNKTLDEQKYLVGDEITFWGVFQMQPAQARTPPSKHMIPDTEYIREREIKNRKPEEESAFSQKLRKLINGK